MSASNKPRLTAAEIAALWTQYQNETAGLCFNSYMHEHMEDREIKDIFEYALSLGQKHLKKIKGFLEAENFPVPKGFSPYDDVVAHSPKLYSDVFCLHYLNIMSIHGAHGYSGAATTSSRKDVRIYYTKCNESALELYNSSETLLQKKGLYFHPPILSPPEKTDFVTNKHFLGGWFGEKRSLTCLEITDIYFNLKKSTLAKAIMIGFSQVTTNYKVRQFLEEASNMKDRHIQTFHEVLNHDHLPTPPTLDAEITDSTAATFSDKLMMFQVGFLVSTAMAYYGAGWSASTRKDLTPKYASAIAGDLKVGSECLNLMIENGWMEKPPLTEDRNKLAQKQ